MKKTSLLLKLGIVLIITMLSVSFAFADTTDGDDNYDDDEYYDDGWVNPSVPGYTLGENGEKALEEFGISPNNVIFANSLDTLSDALDYAGYMAEQSSAATAEEPKPMYMVYMVPGNYSHRSTYYIPENVLLVGEKDTKFTYTGTSSTCFSLRGSVYGGTYIGNPNIGGKKGRVFVFDETTLTYPNGIVKNTSVSKAGWSGIEARGTEAKGGQVIGNTITDCNGNGVRSIGGATLKLVEGNKISGSGQAGIDITCGNVTTIKGNTIKDVEGHGISTDTEQKFDSSVKVKCTIKDVIDNKITDTGKHGIYLEEKCYITGTMKGNKIGKNKKCAIGTHKKTKINNMINNELYGSKMSVFGIYGTANMGSGNSVHSGKAAGIVIGPGAKLYIKGKSNKVYKNKLNGIQLMKSSRLSITGKGTKIYSNRWGVNIGAKKSKATIKYAKFYKNKKGAIYCVKGSSFSKKKCSIKGKVYKAR